eukprot:6204777-Pleurochrysis_carterae.AAC.11
MAAHDIVSPLPRPFYHCGPFMLYKNTPRVTQLWRSSKDWRLVAPRSTNLPLFHMCMFRLPFSRASQPTIATSSSNHWTSGTLGGPLCSLAPTAEPA